MTENSGIIDLLNKLDENSLTTLAKTVTQGMLKINSREEALNSILKYSSDDLSILRRKCVTREILFSYLDEKNIIVKLPITKNELIDTIINYWNSLSNNAECPNSSIVNQSEEVPGNSNGVSALAQQFTSWFYSLLNTEGIGSEHFYSDAILKINMYSNGECDTTIIENNPEEIAGHLNSEKMKHNLHFNPNTSPEGTQGRMNPYGLVMVLACGTLHVEETCVGVFEQVFALARDPFCDNNWKIKNSELNLRSTQVMDYPKLCDSELTSDYLSLPPN